jgi:signal transduction histidine kinase
VVIRSLEQSLAEAERLAEAPLPGGVVRFTLSPQGVHAQPSGRVAWLPVPPPLPPAEERKFVEAEKLEFQEGADRALRAYQELARSSQPAVRAGALLRLARVYRRTGKWDAALAAYRSLGRIDRVAIDGMPANFVARRALCSVLDESGRKQELRQEAGELAAQVVADFRKEVEPRGYTVDLEIEASDGLALRADAASLTNALWNLLDNAVKYSPDGRAVRVSVHRHPSGVAFAVRDQGIGVARHERQEIFRKFVRGERARRLGVKGTGLGLAIVSHIVHAHGGTVELDSEEGAGSTFRLVLPTDA